MYTPDVDSHVIQLHGRLTSDSKRQSAFGTQIWQRRREGEMEKKGEKGD
jgi:hypothetical protein